MDTNKGLFKALKINNVIEEASKLPMPKELYKTFMFEREITLVVADTNVGKSIFALQIANEIAAKRPVLYFDFEMSPKQLEMRYSDDVYKNPHKFNDNLFWVSFANRCEIPEDMSYEEYFLESLRDLVKKYDADVVVIDNMTALALGDTDSAKNAKPIMDKLNTLKIELGLTFLLVEHTRKMNKTRAITLDDMQGSKMKANFADSVIAIGMSHKDEDVRYVKQLKCRSARIDYDADNVLLFELRRENSFLGLFEIGTDAEYKHVQVNDDSFKEERLVKIKSFKAEGKSNRAIAREIGFSEGAIRKIIKQGVRTADNNPKN